MKVSRSVGAVDFSDSGCVLTIGNFDAVHIGHQKILQQLRIKANDMGLPLVVMTFDPNPEQFFRGSQASARLSSVSGRYFALRDLGVDLMVVLPFKQKLASTSAEDFIEKILLQGLNVKMLLIGDDFKFGSKRRGDFAMLEDYGKTHGFEVGQFETVKFDGERVSSTRVRATLANGDLSYAKKLIGRHYSMTGRVVTGQKLGRQWGFPTLNLPVNNHPPLTGVFAVKVGGLGDKIIPGVANLGTRPTVDGLTTLLEVHLFEFDQEVYGKRICVHFIEKIRNEMKFPSFDDLKTQIGKDAERARQILNVGHNRGEGN